MTNAVPSDAGLRACFRPSTRAFVLLAALLLGGCGSTYRAPVDEAGDAPLFLDAGRSHRVNEGETLYAVAWMYDLDPVALARANNLQEPYAISRGQMLTIDLRGAGIADGRARPAAAAAAPVVATAPEGVRVNPVQTGSGINRAPLGGGALQRTPLPAATPPPAAEPPPAPVASPEPAPAVVATAPVVPVAPEPEPEPEPVAAPAPAPQPAAQPEPAAAPAAPAAVAEAAPAPAALPAGPINWAWPSDGRIIGRFTEASVDKKGIDFDGNKGDPVKAAADGQIVYAGSGLLRYGDLIIIKHNDKFLSAYAHNDKILVKEGAMVKQGEVIAELGSSGIDRNMLHFEIRVEGTPVDPMQYLPSR